MPLEHALKQFIDFIDPSKTRIEVLPDIILAFGGRLSVTQGEEYISCRNVFIRHVLSTKFELSHPVLCPEHYPEWNQFEHYPDLIAFEKDACSLAKAIVLFSESEGAFAELGAFCQDEVISERLLVVVSKEHFNANSFIKLGPLKHIESKHSEGSICVVNSIKPVAFENDVSVVVNALREKIQTEPKTQQFNPSRIRDQLLLIAQLVDLFSAVTRAELKDLLVGMGVMLEPKRLKQMINLLQLFELVYPTEKGTQRFLVPPKGMMRKYYLNFGAKLAGEKFDRAKFKMQIFQQDESRHAVFRQAHEAK